MPVVMLALVLALALAWATNGDLRRLGDVPLRHVWLLFVGAALQFIIFPPGMSNRWLGAAVPYLYIASFVMILVALLLNWRVRGVLLAALGVGLNLLAIISNGGYMPASAQAAQRAGITDTYVPLAGGAAGAMVHQNSLLAPDPNLLFLGDVFVLELGPIWPLVFSVGDVLLGAGVFWLIMHCTRRPPGKHRVKKRSDTRREAAAGDTV